MPRRKCRGGTTQVLGFGPSSSDDRRRRYQGIALASLRLPASQMYAMTFLTRFRVRRFSSLTHFLVLPFLGVTIVVLLLTTTAAAFAFSTL